MPGKELVMCLSPDYTYVADGNIVMSCTRVLSCRGGDIVMSWTRVLLCRGWLDGDIVMLRVRIL